MGIRKKAVAAAVLVLLLLIGVLVWFLNRDDSGKIPLTTPHSIRATSAPSQPGGKLIKVGIYLSHYCATGADGTEWVYGHSCQMVGELHDPAFDLIPLLEPNTETEESIPKLIQVYFKGHKPADVMKLELLKSLDVIVLPRINYIPEDSLAAIDAAVKSGVGLLVRNTFGNGVPGYTPGVNHLQGYEEAEFSYSPKPTECEILAEHPILGKLKKGDVIQVTPNGAYGAMVAGSVPLIQVKDTDVLVQNPPPAGQNFYPLFVSQYGKGKIVHCAFPAWEPTPSDLQKATGGRFNIRVVKWLAGKPLD